MLCSEYTQAAKLHIEEIRSQKFSIGKKESNPLTQDLCHGVTSLSAELYTKDVHFLMELTQNAGDNEYEKSVEPTLEFILTKEDITGNGAPATLLIFNNEVGFSKKNMESLYSVGRSTNKGKKQQGFIGEKAMDTESDSGKRQTQIVVLGILCLNGCGESLFFRIFLIYMGQTRGCPQPYIYSPLRPEKVEAVKLQLSKLHPEILLFLSKVKRLYVRENERESVQNDNVTVASIASETNHVKLSSKGADSRVVQFSVKEKTCDAEETCKYFMWRQAFPVKPENRVSSRVDVEQWSITLAFHLGTDGDEGLLLLFMEFGDLGMCSNIIFEFFSALSGAELSVFFNGPANPKAVVRILPKFRLLLFQIKKKGASLHGLYKLKKDLHSSLDHQKYTPILDFLGVVYADPGRDWYAKCIETCNLVAQDSTEVYMEILCFVAENDKISASTYFRSIPLLNTLTRKGVWNCVLFHKS
ncbi:Histidine kinase-like ATPase, C-terminal domain containing protein [Parasponia andersonii]|uniref:Histidine kinase-like ATPase, C-terminal domain containing protein n=1 Tax=Parasponia andersonii TaxID=3476 RepID=A0A2P5CX01_PARAD|nr:Histidine kinase-like ATPase, C-terminal domain containing protein [Parasponia andersonii]